LTARLRIEAGGRFVEQEKYRVVDDGDKE